MDNIIKTIKQIGADIVPTLEGEETTAYGILGWSAGTLITDPTCNDGQTTFIALDDLGGIEWNACNCNGSLELRVAGGYQTWALARALERISHALYSLSSIQNSPLEHENILKLCRGGFNA